MADLVGPDPLSGTGPLAGHVSVLEHVHRFAADSAVAALAGPCAPVTPLVQWRSSTASRLTCRGCDPTMPQRSPRWSEWQSTVPSTWRRAPSPATPRGAGSRNWRQVLAARRLGRLSAADWSERIEAAVAERVSAFSRYRRWAPGRPVIVTANDALNGLSNGDVGVVVTDGDSVAVAMAGPSASTSVPPHSWPSSNGGGP